MLGDHQPIVLGVFNGLFDRSSFDDAVPSDHGSIAKNIVFTQLGYRTRGGTELVETVGTIRRLAIYKRRDEVPRILILDTSGNLYDSLDLLNPILSIAAMVDFSASQYFDRIYITPHNRVTGIENEVVYVYDGTTCRAAGGIAPSGSITVTNSALSGNVEAGTHLIAVAFETESGFITRPGPSIYGSVLADGTHQIDISGIPTGPTGTAARHILATRRIPNYDGNQDGYEFFFVPTGRIAGNVDTTATLNFFDADLLSSADYLFDQLQTIPAGVGVGVYQNSLVVWGSYNEPSRVSISRQGEPESFDSVVGYLNVAPTEAGGVKTCTEFRDSLYMMKSRKSFQTSRDYTNPNSPIFWKVNNIDEGIGTEPFGLCEVLDTKGPNLDNFLIASQLGAVLFNGVFVNPIFSWKIDTIWDSIDRDRFNEIQVFNDSVSQRFYFLLPNSSILVGDYQNGLGSDAVRWSTWVFPWTISAICLDVDEDDQSSRLLIAGNGNIYELTSALSDAGTAIATQVRYAPRSLDDIGGVLTFGGVRLRAKGSGTLELVLYGEDNIASFSVRDVTLGATPGKEYTRKTNFNNEKAALDLQLGLFNEYIEVFNVKLFASPLWLERPNV